MANTGGKLIVQILLDGADSVKAALEQLGVAGRQSVEGLNKALGQVSPDTLASGIKTATAQSKASLDELSSSAKSAIQSIQSSFGTVIPLAAIEAPFLAVKALLADLAASAAAAFVGIGAGIARLLEFPIDVAFALGLGALIEKFNGVGTAAANFGRNLFNLGGGLLGVAAAAAVVGAAFTGIVFGLFEFAKSASNAVLEISHLATLAGTTVKDMSGLTAALARTGVSTDSLTLAFRRLATGIESNWEAILKKTREASAETIRNHLAVQEATLGIVKAEEALKASQGLAADPGLQQLIREKEALLGVEKARLTLSEAIRKSQEDEANSVQGVAQRVNDLINGVTVLRGGFQAADLTAKQLFQGAIIGAAQTATGIKIIRGGIVDLASAVPTAEGTLLRLADIFQKLPDGPLKTRTAFEAFGRSVGPELIDALSKGRNAILEIKAAVEAEGLAFDDVDKKFASKFLVSYVRLGEVLSRTKTQLGQLFEPAFAEGMDLLTRAIEANRGTLLDWGRDIAETVKPVIIDFFKLLAGRQDIDTTWLVALRDGFSALGTAISTAWGIIKPILSFLHDGFELLANTLNNVFGTRFTAGGLEAAAILGLIAAKFGLISGAIALLLPLLGPVGAAIALVAAALLLFNWDKFKKDLDDSIEQWRGWIRTITGFDLDAFLSNQLSKLGEWARKNSTLVQGVIDIWQKLKSLWAGLTGPSVDLSGASAAAGGGSDGGDGGGFAAGGVVSGSRKGFLAMLHGLEFVIQERALRKFGVSFFNMLNAGFLPPGFASGGFTGGALRQAPAVAGGSSARHVLNLTIDGQRFDGLGMTEDTANALARFAVSRQISSTGRRPSWDK